MTIILTILMFVIAIWCYSTDAKSGAGIFALLGLGGVISLIMESIPQNWKETTPTSIAVFGVLALIFLVYHLITSRNDSKESTATKNQLEKNHTAEINQDQKPTSYRQDEPEIYSKKNYKFDDGSMDDQIKERVAPVYKEISDELGREATHNDLIKDFIQTFGKEETRRILPGLERASKLLGREVTNTSHLFN